MPIETNTALRNKFYRAARYVIALLSGREEQAPAPDEAVASTGLSVSQIHDMILWTDGIRYVEELLSCFKLPCVTLIEANKLATPHIALRHDVDWSIENALAMAQLEYSNNITATYFLLHPDGFVQTRNYFGFVEDSKLHIDPNLFDYAKRLIDCGHEVALHSDLITLGLYTRRQPFEFLEQICESFQNNGVPVKGTVAHGSPKCREFGYVNFQIFKECTEFELEQTFMAPTVENDGFQIEKHTLYMRDFGLAYEGNFIPWEAKLSDSRANWTLELGLKKTSFQKFEDKATVLYRLQQIMADKTPGGAVQCLVHPCHWSTLSNFNTIIREPIINKRERGSLAIAASAVQKYPNVVYAKHNSAFASYDKVYAENEQHFVIATSLKNFTEAFIADKAKHITNVLEVGCGQGDYLNFFHQLHHKACPDSQFNGCGVDGSFVGIDSCATRYPDCFWVADTGEAFLKRATTESFERAPWLRNLDLVIDKTGTTYIKDYDVAEAFFDHMIELMAPGGGYLFLASRNFYENKMRINTYNTWHKHWMELAESKFSRTEIFDDDLPELKGYYKRVYWRS